jgi:hypothetical protein
VGFRSPWELLAFLRLLMLTLALCVFLGGFLVVSKKVPWLPWLVALLLVAAAARNLRGRRGSSSRGGRESHGVDKSLTPAWLDDARVYYSEIGEPDSGEPISVFAVPAEVDEVNGESSGTLYLRLQPHSYLSPRVRVLDAGGREEGIICSEWLVPGVRYAMYRNGELVWKLSVRSIVRKRHVLELANGVSWTFDTPFFWWQNLTGTASGAARLLGGLVMPTTKAWGMWVEPGWDTFDVLAAVALLHSQYWHS